jgi:hypothetical protein
MYNYNPYTNYNNQFNPFANQNNIQQMEQIRDQWDQKIQLAQQQQQNQMQQPQVHQQPSVTQNFQLAPTTSSNSELEGRYAENIDEVKNTFVMKTGIFATKDYSTVWVKDVSGNIKIFKTEEIIPRDEKDMQIQALQEELNNMKELMEQAMQPTPQTEEKPKTNKK